MLVGPDGSPNGDHCGTRNLQHRQNTYNSMCFMGRRYAHAHAYTCGCWRLLAVLFGFQNAAQGGTGMLCMHTMYASYVCMLCMRGVHACHVRMLGMHIMHTHACYAYMSCMHAMNACYARMSCMHGMYALYACMVCMFGMCAC